MWSSIYASGGKRVLDIVLAGAALLALVPLMLLVAGAVRLEDGGPAIFRQVRVGRDQHRFTLMKFRSMPITSPNLPSIDAGRLKLIRSARAAAT